MISAKLNNLLLNLLQSKKKKFVDNFKIIIFKHFY